MTHWLKAPGVFARGFLVFPLALGAIGCSQRSVVQIPDFSTEKSVFKTGVQEPITKHPRKMFCINVLF